MDGTLGLGGHAEAFLDRFSKGEVVALDRDAEMLVEAQQRLGDARREVHRHIGDYTVFWTGVFPESLREKQSPSSKDHLLDYCAQGKRAYLIASSIDTD